MSTEVTKTTAELFAEMESLWNDFATNHAKFSGKGVKASAARARKAINSLRKFSTPYKKASVVEVKAEK